ncbi:MAG: hypothetical protein U0269_09805 [Polyangiales bacterium]
MPAACRAPRTQIVVVVDTDFAVPSRVGALRLRITDPRDGNPVIQPIVLKGIGASGCTDSPSAARFCVPLSFLLVPAANRPANAPAEVTVEAVSGDDPVAGATLVSRSARLAFAPGQTLRLPMFLSRDCEGVVCPSDFTCSEGARCVPLDHPPGVVQLDPNSGRALDGAVFDSSTPDAIDPLDATTPHDASGEMDVSRPDVVASDVATDSADAASDSADVALAPLCAAATCPAIASLVSGRDFSCARYATGRLACWGSNEHGQLGRGTTTALEPDGSGGLFEPQWVSGIAGVVSLGAGAMHACAASNSAGVRQVFCWGFNRDGSLGTGAAGSAVSTPSVVPFFTARASPDELALGREASYARIGRELFAWGHNGDGALGFGSGAVVTTPVQAAATQVRALSARERGLCFVDRPDTFCAGINNSQRFGAVAAAGAVVASPTAVDTALRKDVFALGRTFACGITSGTVTCWGENRRSGVLGAIPAVGAPDPVVVPRVVPLAMANAVELALAEDFVLARLNDGTVFCWGSNAEGACAFGSQMADGSITPVATAPRPIVFPSRFAAPARAITAGDGHACALDSAQVLWCWGRNRNGQAGQSVTADPRSRAIIAPSPVILPAP